MELPTTTEDAATEGFIGAKVFSCTKGRDRENLGERITEWIRSNPEYRIVSKDVTQSSDREFHCFTVTLFYQH